MNLSESDDLYDASEQQWTSYDYMAATIFYCSGCLGIPANITLIVLILTKSPKSLSVYRVFLLNVAIAELVFSLSSTIGQIRIIPNKWAFAYVPLGIARFFSPGSGYFVYSTQLHAIFYTFMSFPLSFGYRYYVLIRPQPTMSTAICICLCLWSVSLAQNILFIFSEAPPEQVRDYLRRNKPSYKLTGWPVSGNNMLAQPLTCVTLATIVLPMFPIYALVLYFYRKAHNVLSSKLTMTESTVRGHKRLIRALTIQASLPLLFIFPPITIYGLYHLELINFTIIEYLVYVLFSFFPACSPLVTLYFVRPYNEAIQRTLCCRKISEQANRSTVGQNSEYTAPKKQQSGTSTS